MANKFLSDTLHVLCIATNCRYTEENKMENTMDSFERTLDIFKKFPTISPLINPLGITYSYLKDYITGMYPEFKEPLEFFQPQAKKIQKLNRYLTKDELAACFRNTMEKYPQLKKHYDFASAPTQQQMERLNQIILPKQKEDLSYAPEAIAKIGMALADACGDFRIVDKFMHQCSIIESTCSKGLSPKQKAQFKGLPGVLIGLKLFDLKKAGIIDEDLNILDTAKFYNADIIKNFPFGNKKYDLTGKTQRPAHGPLHRIITMLLGSKNSR